MRLMIAILIGCLSFYTTLLFADSNDNKDALHLDWLDKTVNPGKDFFQFANGSWQKSHPIPAAYPSWNIFYVLDEKNQLIIKELLESAAKNPNNKPGSVTQKVGDFYYSGMNEQAINEEGIKPLAEEFNRIQEIKNLTELQTVVTHLQAIGVNAVFSFGQMQDFKDSNKVIGVAGQDGLGLPDRDYYLKQDSQFQKIRAQYITHMTKMFMLLGDSSLQATKEANTVMTIETAFAKASMSRVAMRDPNAIYHIMTKEQLMQITPHFSWSNYFTTLKHPEINTINLATPDFFKTFDNMLNTLSLDEWKSYLRWHLIHATASYLSQPFVDENFHMLSVLTGAEKILPRWKRVVITENAALGFAIGKLYVENNFSESSKLQVQAIINNIRSALQQDLAHLNWMTPATRREALKKLNKMEDRVGYPDKWRDYSALTIDRGSYVLNVLRANKFDNDRELNKIGKPVDRSEWDMTPQTINAYYDPSTNRLNIPAGILQPPFFDPHAPAAINYGAIGFVIGHEMTHGFDDQGAQFDEKGNLKNWWSSQDLKKFHATTQSIANQFTGYTVADGQHLQGRLVLGEATADLGGLILAYHAYHNSHDFKVAKPIDGFLPDQQFFLGAAHVWAANVRPEEAKRLVLIDPHPPAKYRINGTLANMPQFQLAFDLAAKSAMVNSKRSVIW